MQLNQLWAKTEPFQSVTTHAIVSGIVAGVLYEEYLSAGSRRKLSEGLKLSGDGTRAFLSYLVSLHDVGKIEEHFQRKDLATLELLKSEGLLLHAPRNNVGHEKTGRDFLRQRWKKYGLKAATAYSDIIGAHHQGLGRCSCYSEEAPWNELREEFEEQMRSRFWGDEICSLPSAKDANRGALAAILLGCVILSDWIASGIAFSDAENWIREKNAAETVKARAEKFLKDSGLKPTYAEWPESFCALWPFISEEQRRPLQTETEQLFIQSDKRASVLLIEAPMGEGKTEAGVYAALQMMRQWGKDGIYMALPTSATSNQMVGRLRDMLTMHGRTDTVRLLHAMAWLIDEQTPEREVNIPEEAREVSRWLAPVKRGLLGQYAVGTVDQAMMAATIAKHGVLRLLGLANKVLIIDEIHSYDVFMGAIIDRLLAWCRDLQIPVVMLSATLPPKQKETLLKPFTDRKLGDAYPLLTAVLEDGSIEERVVTKTSREQTVQITTAPLLNQPAKIAELAADIVKDGGCLCVLMNTVNEAQQVYEALKTCYNGDLHLFHARFPAAVRAEREQECLCLYGKDKTNRPDRSILVATQVVEQSLDVDFDAMLTAVAPIDLVLQRMGRVFRHDNAQRPKSLSKPQLCVLIPETENAFGSSKFVYAECLLRQSVHLLQKRDSIQIPNDLAPLVAAGYDENAAPPEEAEKWIEQYFLESAERMAADKYLLSPPDKKLTPFNDDILLPDEEHRAIAVRTRLGEPAVTVTLAEPELMDKLAPCITGSGENSRAEVKNRKLAKEVLEKSFSVRESQLRELSGLLYIKGDNLLIGTRIIPVHDGVAQTEEGVLRYDRELGVIIKKGR